MNILAKFPRPPDDNGLGMHFGSVTPRNFEHYLPLLKDMNIKWLVLTSAHCDLIGRVAERCLEENIMPIARPYTKIDSRAKFSNKARWCKSPYVQIYNEPENPREWEYGVPEDCLNRFWYKWIGAAHAVRSVGCKPGLQVTSPKDLRTILNYMTIRSEDTDLWPDMWLALHLYPHLGCPPTCIQHDDDALSFLKYDEVAYEISGIHMPQIVTEWAWTPSQAPPETRAKWATDVYGWFRDGGILDKRTDITLLGRAFEVFDVMPLPDYLFSFCYWILSGLDWYGFSLTQNPAHKPVLDAICSLEPFVRGAPNEPETANKWRVVSEWLDVNDVNQALTNVRQTFPNIDWDWEEREDGA